MALKEGVKNMMANILGIQKAVDSSIVINESMSHKLTCLKNRVLYRGDSSEIEQFFKQIANDNVSKSRFWAAVPSQGHLRKCHSGIYSIIIDNLTDLVLADLQKIDIEDAEILDIWKEIAVENKWDFELLRDAISETLIVGDGVFKISVDTDISKLPIVEFVSGENVDYVYKRGRLQEVKFNMIFAKDNIKYRLEETYGRGYIKYKLYANNKEVSIRSTEETKNLKDITFAGSFIMAVPLSFYKSPKFSNRGQALLEKKSENIDSLDETVSQWVDALRQGRVKNYVPEDLLPRDPVTGEIKVNSSFDNMFITLGSSLKENSADKIEQIQANINYDAFAQTYASMLDLVLQGIISPCSLGIDLKKTDNAEAQREKEKTTIKTRKKIIDTLIEVIPSVLNTTLKVYFNLNNKTIKDYEISVVFGEYASASFNEKINLIGVAASSNIMSVERQVDELWGDTLSEEEKAEEVERIKELRGIIKVDEEITEIDSEDSVGNEDDFKDVNAVE